MKNLVFIIAILAAMFAALTTQAQHHHHAPVDTVLKKTTKPMPADSAKHKQHKHDTTKHKMIHSFSLSLPMNRNGSGTSWLPDNTPMYAYMLHGKNGWNYMLHGNLYVRNTWQNFSNNYKRGGKQFDAPNWLMGMAQKQVGKNGLLNFNAMLSADRLVMAGNGYPLLYQSGEAWDGSPLVDRQHPHDLFAALSVAYTHRITNDIDITGYAGYPGEPALGPTAFMHRISSLSNPDAPLGHHWQDATHIVFGVATLGVRYKWLKAEGSLFTGREPDENRYDFDKPRFDSYSFRLSANPTKSISMQVSYGYIKSPEQLSPDEDVRRTTASVIHSTKMGNAYINSALVWGYNNAGHGHTEHSVLAESSIAKGKNTIYGRYEFVEKSAHELQLEDVLGHNAIEPIHSLSIGYSRTLFTIAKTNIAVGGQMGVGMQSKKLDAIYGKMPLSGQVYLRITPAMLKMGM